MENNTEQEKTTETPRDEKPRDPFQEAWKSAEWNSSAVCDAVKEIGSQIEDGLMSLVPPDVTKHLLNSKKELVQAGVRMTEILGDKAHKWEAAVLADIERKAARAEEIHKDLKEKKAEAKT